MFGLGGGSVARWEVEVRNDYGLFSSSMRRMPHGMPTPALGSEEKDTGLSQRRVMAGLIRVDLRIARPNDDKSPAEVYMFPVLDPRVNKSIRMLLTKRTLLPRPVRRPIMLPVSFQE